MLEDKLLSGYAYRTIPISNKITNPFKRNININTGIGGAKILIEMFRNIGMSDDTISSLIEVLIPEVGWVKLRDTNIKIN